MAVRSLVQKEDPLLHASNTSITSFKRKKLVQLITDLTDTMRSTGLVGIAAPQIGENYQVFLTEPRETPTRSKDQTDILRVYINPILTHFSEEKIVLYEGCGSVNASKSFGPVNRPKEVIAEAWDESGKKFRLTCDGLLARIIQHEVDHLKGIEFIDKVEDPSSLLTYEQYMELKKNDPDLKEAAKITKIECIYL